MELMTAKEIAGLFKMAQSYVEDKVTRRPDFPKPYRLGRVRRWPKSEIEAWLEKRRY